MEQLIVIAVLVLWVPVMGALLVLVRERRRWARDLAGVRAALAPLVGIRSDLDLVLSRGLTQASPSPTPAVPPLTAAEPDAEAKTADDAEEKTAFFERPPPTASQIAPAPSSRARHRTMRPPPISTAPITPTRPSADSSPKVREHGGGP